MGQARLVSRTASAAEARACSDLLKQAQTYLQRAKVGFIFIRLDFLNSFSEILM